MASYAFNKNGIRISVLVLIACCFALPTRAQVSNPLHTTREAAKQTELQETSVERFAPAVDATNLDTAERTHVPAVSNSLTDVDLTTLTREEWKKICKEQFEALGSSDDIIWDEALANITYLSTNYPDKVDFTPACPWLLNTFVFARWQQARIASLAAIHAIGDEETMVKLAHLVQDERNPKVHGLMLAVLADFYKTGKKPVLTIGEPGQISGTTAIVQK